VSEWPVDLRGVTETVVATLGPNDRWNQAALGVHAPDSAGEPATARTFGDTRTRRNFHRRGEGYVQFVDDPVDFADAALSVLETGNPLLDGTTAWARVEVEQTGSEENEGTAVEHWALTPVESAVVREGPFAPNRGFYAVVEATIAVSRLDVDAYDTDELRERLRYFGDVVDAAGGARERAAMGRVREHADTDW
jgi:hypothetical protein